MLESPADHSSNYELELAKLDAIFDDNQHLEEEEALLKPEEPSPEDLDPSDLFAYVLLQSSSEDAPEGFQGGVKPNPKPFQKSEGDET